MGTWDSGTAEFECPKCGAKHVCDYRDYPVRDRGEFACLKCGAELHRWNGARDYFDLRLVDDAQRPQR